MLTSETWELRNQVRVETLRDLITIVRERIELTPETLEEMARECEAARASVDLLSMTIEPEGE